MPNTLGREPHSPQSSGGGTWDLITVSHNSEAAISHFWGRAELPGHVRWTVVDNDSSDGSAQLAAALGASVIRLPKNVGFGAANNVGFRSTTAEFVGFVNPDVTPQPGDLARIAELAERHSALVSPQLLHPDGTAQPNGRGLPFLVDKVGGRLGSKPVQERYLRVADATQVLRVHWLMGAAVLGRRVDFARLGPWDERFFVYYQDSDLGLRAANLGIDRLLDGTSRWEHGWARETKHLRWGAWRREIASAWKFYTRYPELLSPIGRVSRRTLQRRSWLPS